MGTMFRFALTSLAGLTLVASLPKAHGAPTPPAKSPAPVPASALAQAPSSSPQGAKHEPPAAGAGNAESDRPSPKAWLQNRIDRAQSLADRAVNPESQAAEAWTEEAKSLIDDTVAWDELVRRSLGRHWKTLDGPAQEKFSRLMRELIQASYQSKLRLALQENEKVRDRENPKVRWRDTKLKEEEAHLSASVRAGRRRLDLDFHLLWKDGRWRMVDLAIDGAPTVGLYRSQFRKIIREESYDALVSRLERKLEDVKAGRGTFVPGEDDEKSTEGPKKG